MAGPPNPYCLHLDRTLGQPISDISIKSMDQLPLKRSAVAKGSSGHVKQDERRL